MPGTPVYAGARMKRAEIRVLKRRLARNSTPDAALALLERSVRFGHGRLAVRRLDDAMQIGAQLPSDVVRYFEALPVTQRQAMLDMARHPVARRLLGGSPRPVEAAVHQGLPKATHE